MSDRERDEEEIEQFRAYAAGTLDEEQERRLEALLQSDASLRQRYDEWLSSLAARLLEEESELADAVEAASSEEAALADEQAEPAFDEREFRAHVAQRLRRRSAGRLYGRAALGSALVTWIAVVGVVVFGVLAMTVWLEARRVSPDAEGESPEQTSSEGNDEQRSATEDAGRRRALGQPLSPEPPREEVEAPGQSIDYSYNVGRVSGQPVRQMQRVEFVLEAVAGSMDDETLREGLIERFGASRVREAEDGYAIAYRPSDLNEVLRRLQEFGLRIERTRRMVEPDELVDPTIHVRIQP